MKLYINTLGEFDIKADGQSIIKQSSRTYKLFRLFEYFLTFRNKKLLPETIIDNLFISCESDDPKNMLRTQIFRLRQVIKKFSFENLDETQYLTISFNNGYYCLEIGEDVFIDVDEFESYIKRADLELEFNAQISIELYYNALKLYNGLYLSDNAYEVWLVPTRNYYQRLYLKTLYKLIDLLKEKEENDKIISLCEQSLLIEPYEENIHINLIEAMLRQGEQKLAYSHYEYSLNLLENELDTKPSVKFTELLYSIQNYNVEKESRNINISNGKLENDLFGAMQCSLESFKFLYKIQTRKSTRKDENDYLCIVTLENLNDGDTTFSKNSRNLSEILRISLRKGDVFTISQNQIMILLHDVRVNSIDKIKNRLQNNFMNSNIIDYAIKIEFKPLVTEKTII